MLPTRALAATATLLALTASAAWAQETSRSTAKIAFSTKQAKTSTGLSVDVRPAPGTDGKPRILSGVELRLPKGTRIDTRATTACTLKTQEVADRGGPGKACPAGSKVGTGSAQVQLGGNPVIFGIEVFNAPIGGKPYLLLDLQLDGSSAYTVTGVIKGSTVDFELGRAEELDARTQRITFKIAKAGTAAKPFLRTPASCPSTGRLKASTFLTYTTSADLARTTIACARKKR